MTWYEALAIVAAGMGAGGVNAIVGSGSLITFPTLLAFGYPAVVANVSNNIGLVPGSISGVYGFRKELRGQLHRVRACAAGSGLGGLCGGVLLLTLPSDVFDAVVPVLVLAACGLMLAQPRLAARLAERRAGREAGDADKVGIAPVAVAFVAGIYGGYFGAAQGVILLATMGVLLPDRVERTNALKNVLAGTVNTVAAVLFIAVAEVAWEAVALVGLGAVVGGALGARVGRRVNRNVLRWLVVTVGVVVAARLGFRQLT